MRSLSCLLVLLTTLASSVWLGGAAVDDWPQYLGAARDGVYRGAPLAASWPASGPRVLWKRPVGSGFSGPVVAGGKLILFHRVKNEEVIEALDTTSGAPIWRYAYPTTYRDDFGFDEGPRAVPVVVNGIVYTFGAQGQLHAVGLADGKKRWSEDTATRFKVPKGFFGAAGSPLVEDGRLLANVGGPGAGIVAFEAATGKVLWTATDDGASYASPVGATIGGKRVAVFLTRAGVVGVEPATGSVVFRRPWRARIAASVNAASPIVVEDRVFVTAEYGPGAGLLRISGSQLLDVWTDVESLTAHYATPVLADGILYGYHGRQEFGQALRAVELSTGKVRWSQERFRAGSIILAGDLLVIMREGGELVLADATPSAFRPRARAQVLPAVVRAFPALSAGILYVRNEETLVALDLRK
ncbi:MAG: PQQ-binding-like beta-propeller repeat protein [Vicinamibacterales bacterium]